MYKLLFLLILSLQLGSAAAQYATLEKNLQQYLNQKQATVGVAVIFDGKDTLTVHNDQRYPLMSVFKFHQALATAHRLEKRGISLDTLIRIEKGDLLPDTYSPLRDRYPEGGISLPVRTLLEYTLQQSDNNACDILFARMGGTAATDTYMRQLGLKEFAIQVNEDEMHQDVNRSYDNWSTPLEAARLTDMLFTRPMLKGDNLHFIKQTMIECQTGTTRLVKPLKNKKGVIVGHKTGTGDRNARGELIGTNDAGFVLLPDGRRYTLAVLVKDSPYSSEETEQIIADISETVYRFFTSEQP